MNLDHLVTAIQQGVLASANALQDHNLKLIDIYFEKSDEEAINSSFEETLRKSIKGQDVEKANKLVNEVMDNISEDLKDMFHKEQGKIQPKTVTLQYPRITSNGPEIHDVIVPLISLIPITLTEISSVKFEADLEVQMTDDKLSVSFPSKIKADSEDKNYAKLEVCIDKTTTPDGLKLLIEGYDKALRAQIPG